MFNVEFNYRRIYSLNKKSNTGRLDKFIHNKQLFDFIAFMTPVVLDVSTGSGQAVTSVVSLRAYTKV
ncbi:hypothetical protein HanHA300_Chr10g0350731 [Helianthus annuus]|nr:hypothetical protein HanHA300_Chr10g0350731 [Helianthus annuus]KAJ0528969.1 hypothetical protein HanHA89_Chr10g0372431 [Helianthus annuus]KAJ0695885.1 hypothetical protein HanLR1_Chr10g0350651 [Helianthus annuus]